MESLVINSTFGADITIIFRRSVSYLVCVRYQQSNFGKESRSEAEEGEEETGHEEIQSWKVCGARLARLHHESQFCNSAS